MHTRAVAALFGMVLVTSCSGGSSGGGGGTTSSSGAGNSSSGGSGCPTQHLQATGSLTTSIADISYAGRPVTAEVIHKLDVDLTENGCFAEGTFELTLGTQGGCKFTLELAGQRLVAVELVADSACPGFLDAVEDTYTLAASGALWWAGPQTAGQDAMASECLDNVQLAFPDVNIPLMGASRTRSLTINLRGLSFSGSLASAGQTSVRCMVPTPACVGFACGAFCFPSGGEDANNCGACGRTCRTVLNRDEAICQNGQCALLLPGTYDTACTATCAAAGATCVHVVHRWEKSFGPYTYESDSCYAASIYTSNLQSEWVGTDCVCQP